MQLPPDLAPWQQALLCDPQTSGGLLVSCAPEAAGEVLAQFRGAGFDAAAEIGALRAGPAVITVEHTIGRVANV